MSLLSLDYQHPQGKLDADKRKSLIQQGKDLKDNLAVLEAKLEALQDSLQREGQLLPNLAHPSVSPHRCPAPPAALHAGLLTAFSVQLAQETPSAVNTAVMHCRCL